LAHATLFGRWSEIVGGAIAAHAAPKSLVDGDLLIEAESTAWATQLRMLAPTLMQRINGRVGRGTVGRIRVQGPTGPSWRFGNRSVPGRGQRDTYG
jgi:predicted nucleic acid-binding Zn ribbon protein